MDAYVGCAWSDSSTSNWIMERNHPVLMIGRSRTSWNTTFERNIASLHRRGSAAFHVSSIPLLLHRRIDIFSPLGTRKRLRCMQNMPRVWNVPSKEGLYQILLVHWNEKMASTCLHQSSPLQGVHTLLRMIPSLMIHASVDFHSSHIPCRLP